MNINITLKYLSVLFFLWVAPVISAIWGAPIWVTVSFMCFFAIYGGHEWTHVYICHMHGIYVESVNLISGGETHILFEPATGENKNKIESDIYLAGAAWDTIFFSIAIFNAIFYGFVQKDNTPVVFATSLIFLLIFNLAMEGSDWQEFSKRTLKRA